MGSDRVIVGTGHEGRPQRFNIEAGFRVLAGFGMLFLLASGVDILLALLPADLSVADVRFTALGATAGALPLAALGTLAVLMSALGLGGSGPIKTASILSLTLALVMVVALVLFVGSYEETRAAASAELTDLVNATLKRGAASYLFFSLACVAGGVFGLRSSRARNG